jgi:hypothetical protein
MDPNFSRAQFHLASNYREMGRYEKPSRNMKKRQRCPAVNLRADGTMRINAPLAIVYMIAGRKREPQRILEGMDRFELRGDRDFRCRVRLSTPNSAITNRLSFGLKKHIASGSLE